MVHLPPLPGSPRDGPDRAALRATALADAHKLTELDGILVENFGDAPFYPDDVPKHVVSELTATVRELAIAVSLPFGVNVLRNDAEAALAVAAATGGAFIRVNVHSGVQMTDQGLLEGRAHETLRRRKQLDADVAIFADIDVKHATPPAERDIATVATETVDRGLADALVVSGPATGESVDRESLKTVLDGRDDATRDVPVFVGSGVTPDNVSTLLTHADGAIVGTALKRHGETSNRIDSERVEQLLSESPR